MWLSWGFRCGPPLVPSPLTPLSPQGQRAEEFILSWRLSDRNRSFSAAIASPPFSERGLGVLTGCQCKPTRGRGVTALRSRGPGHQAASGALSGGFVLLRATLLSSEAYEAGEFRPVFSKPASRSHVTPRELELPRWHGASAASETRKEVLVLGLFRFPGGKLPPTVQNPPTDVGTSRCQSPKLSWRRPVCRGDAVPWQNVFYSPVAISECE